MRTGQGNEKNKKVGTFELSEEATGEDTSREAETIGSPRGVEIDLIATAEDGLANQ